eukprot:GGOE01019193.1.p1 GENE.GGOE01019193.1~~GGOE01019193.1.p1  ORF type:complete len:580 (+),score=160.71 GGOE01019193.1:47-1786(+)
MLRDHLGRPVAGFMPAFEDPTMAYRTLERRSIAVSSMAPAEYFVDQFGTVMRRPDMPAAFAMAMERPAEMLAPARMVMDRDMYRAFPMGTMVPQQMAHFADSMHMRADPQFDAMWNVRTVDPRIRMAPAVPMFPTAPVSVSMPERDLVFASRAFPESAAPSILGAPPPVKRARLGVERRSFAAFESFGLDAYDEPVGLDTDSAAKATVLQEEQEEPVDVVPAKDAAPMFVHKNDYSQNFFDTNKRPQNFIRDSKYELGFDEYPDLKRLIHMKDKLVRARATSPMFLNGDLRTLDLPGTLRTRFDVILIDPPWYEYHERAPTIVKDYWTAKEISELKVPDLAAEQCFLFMWCGSADAIESGRIIMRSWGFRRCEDIVWIKTNRNMDSRDPEQKVATDISKKGWNGHSVMVHTKEHCLVGMKGTVKRNVDSHFIHANIDTDVIVTEEPEYGSTRKPHELYTVIEHFCNGRRRLELFGETHNVRPGWVTLGDRFVRASNFDAQRYTQHFENRCDFPEWIMASEVVQIYQNHPSGNTPNVTSDDTLLMGSTREIEKIRPQSPPPQSKSSTVKSRQTGQRRPTG